MFFSSWAPAQLALGIPEDLEVEQGVEYLPEPRKERADFYYPLKKAEVAGAAVIYLHGGGFTRGGRDGAREIRICGELARAGYAVLSIDYQLATDARASWPQNLGDCKWAVRWLRENAKEYGIDPERIGVMGASAGGLLAAMLALTDPPDGFDPPGEGISYRVKCAVDLYGISDLGQLGRLAMLGLPRAEAPALYRQASPVNYVSAGDPPMLLIHGSADSVVDPGQSELLAMTLARAGVTSELVLIPGAGHGFDLQPPQRDLRPVVFGFLERHLGARPIQK